MLAEYLARSGMIDTEIAEKLGIGEKTLNEWKRKHPIFRQSMSNGKQRTNDGVKRALLTRALGFEYPHAIKMFYDKNTGEVIKEKYTEYYPPDVRACEIWLLNRDPENWRNRHEHTGEGGGPIAHTHDLAPALREHFDRIIGGIGNKNDTNRG